MSRQTRYLGRLLGIFLLIFAVGQFTQRSAMVEIASEITAAPALLLICGMVTVVAGLAIVLAHNVWRGGATPVIVTILGWLLLIKGAALIVVPSSGWAGALRASHYADFYLCWVAIPLFLGAYLTYAGFRAHQPGIEQKL
jgi:hypothetical protein